MRPSYGLPASPHGRGRIRTIDLSVISGALWPSEVRARSRYGRIRTCSLRVMGPARCRYATYPPILLRTVALLHAIEAGGKPEETVAEFEPTMVEDRCKPVAKEVSPSPPLAGQDSNQNQRIPLASLAGVPLVGSKIAGRFSNCDLAGVNGASTPLDRPPCSSPDLNRGLGLERAVSLSATPLEQGTLAPFGDHRRWDGQDSNLREHVMSVAKELSPSNRRCRLKPAERG